MIDSNYGVVRCIPARPRPWLLRTLTLLGAGVVLAVGVAVGAALTYHWVQ